VSQIKFCWSSKVKQCYPPNFWPLKNFGLVAPLVELKLNESFHKNVFTVRFTDISWAHTKKQTKKGMEMDQLDAFQLKPRTLYNLRPIFRGGSRGDSGTQVSPK